MRKSTVIFVELGMLGGIVVAGYTLPDNTPLWTFLAASGACFLVGNIFLVKKLKEGKSKIPIAQGKPWGHILRALAILAVSWLLILLLYKHWL